MCACPCDPGPLLRLPGPTLAILRCESMAACRVSPDWQRSNRRPLKTVLPASTPSAGQAVHPQSPMPSTNQIAVDDSSHASSKPSPSPTNENSTRTKEGNEISPAVRRRLPDERHSITHHFSIGGQEGYVTVGLSEDGTPGEMFIRMAKEGSTVSGLMDSFATAVSLAMQYRVPLEVLCNKFNHTRFEPSGWSGNPKIGYAKSLMDYLFRWLELRFLKGEQGILFELSNGKQPHTEISNSAKALSEIVNLGDGPTCQFCGSLMVRNGSCYRCMECGGTSGCS
jgi:ribonucleoside-diphosphate reductase alpha chain